MQGKNESPVIVAEWTEDGVKKKYVAELGKSSNDTPLEQFADPSVIYGQYASFCRNADGTCDAVRDPLGIGKLFYTETEDGQLYFSNTFSDLFKYNRKIFSVPAGVHVRLGPDGVRQKIRSLGPDDGIDHDFTLPTVTDDKIQTFQHKIDQRLEQVFVALRKLEDSGWKIFVALSGGLDSSIIAEQAARHLARPMACTLDLGKSEDSEKSIMIAEHLGLEHLTFATSRDEIIEMLEKAPLSCQDFRDFNVHCAVLNLLLAKNIRHLIDSDAEINADRVIVLTGDLMNEFTCDYAGEMIDGIEYYKLPRIGKKELQNYLINGLDTSDREISPFDSYGLKCVQPYAVLSDLYSRLDESILLHEDPKKLLNSGLVDFEIQQFIPKVKLRAQVGSRENMGILGLCHHLGLNNEHFMKSLLEQAGAPQQNIPIFVGRYDVEKFS
jgi:hypothetical protein